MNTDGTSFAPLHTFSGSFSDGRFPYGSLTLSGSKLYGMTYQGGSGNSGSIFSMNTDGTGFGLLHSFGTIASGDGSHPYGSLTLSDSTLYGMTYNGGSSGGPSYGAIFRMNTDGTGFEALHSFVFNDGINPYGSLTLSGSKLYGMTHSGGATSLGTIFSVNTDGTGFSLLHSFTGGVGDGRDPQAGSLTLSGSKLYGMTNNGGSSNSGVIFSINTDGTGFSLLHTFTGSATDGAHPQGTLTLSGSTLFGMTTTGGSSNKGTLFSIGTDGSGFVLLESFGGTPADGAFPAWGELTLSDDGSTFYGMTGQGGTLNSGVVFSAPVPEPGAFALLGLGTLLLATRRRRNAGA